MASCEALVEGFCFVLSTKESFIVVPGFISFRALLDFGSFTFKVSAGLCSWRVTILYSFAEWEVSSCRWFWLLSFPSCREVKELKFSLLVGTCKFLRFLTSDEALADMVLKCSWGGKSAFGTTFRSTEQREPYFVYLYLRFDISSERID